jgi:hypothetical protein
MARRASRAARFARQPPRPARRALLNQGAGIVIGVERPQILELFADAD